MRVNSSLIDRPRYTISLTCSTAVRNRHNILGATCEAQYKREDVDIDNFLLPAVRLLAAMHRKIAATSEIAVDEDRSNVA